jgi:hypothetical protein
MMELDKLSAGLRVRDLVASGDVTVVTVALQGEPCTACLQATEASLASFSQPAAV